MNGIGNEIAHVAIPLVTRDKQLLPRVLAPFLSSAAGAEIQSMDGWMDEVSCVYDSQIRIRARFISIER